MQTVCANESGVKEKERARDANRRVGWSAQGLREGAAASGDARANLGGHPAPRPPGDRRHHDRAEKVFVHTFLPTYRSPTQRDEHGAASIVIISNVVVDNTPTISNTRGRPLWLWYHRLTVGVRPAGRVNQCAARLPLANYRAHHRIVPSTSDRFS